MILSDDLGSVDVPLADGASVGSGVQRVVVRAVVQGAHVVAFVVQGQDGSLSLGRLHILVIELVEGPKLDVSVVGAGKDWKGDARILRILCFLSR